MRLNKLDDAMTSQLEDAITAYKKRFSAASDQDSYAVEAKG